MTQYDNEFFRGPPEGSPTLATDQRPTGVEIFQARPEKTTAVADVPVTQEEVPKDPPKKKSNAKRINKAIKLLASCMAAVVITEAATNIAATIEPPPEVPTGLYYEGQWPGVNPVHGGMYSMDMDADMGYSIQVPVADQVWRLTAPNNWRMCWYEGIYQVYMGMYDRDTDVFLMADLTPEPFYTDNEEDCYTTVTTSTGDTLYVRAFFLSLGKYAEEYGMEDYGQSEEMLAASAQLRQELVEEAFAGIRVTPGTEDGWQGFQIGDHLYSQQGSEWYGLGGIGDLDIHIPWVNYAEDYNLHNMTPYSRVNVNGITWSIYFAENDTYLWAVPNIDPEICLGGYVSRFMCADAVRRGEYINDEEWLEMGGFTSVSQRQTAVDILIECLQHHYALRDRWYPRDWPWKGPTDDHASYWIWAESVKGTWTQFSFGDEAYRVNSTDPELRFYWEETKPLRGDVIADLEISRMVNNEEEYAIGLTVCRMPFNYVGDNSAYRTVQASGGETLYLEFRSQYHGDGPDFTSAEMEPIADRILRSITFQSNPDDSGWCPLLLCDTMHSPANMEWSGCGIVGTNVAIDYIHTVESEGLNHESPIGTQNHNGITWTLYYDRGDEKWDSCIWAVPDIEPDVCIGFNAIVAMEYYRQQNMEYPDYEGDENYELTAEDKNHAAETVSEALAYIYPLGVEPEKEKEQIWHTQTALDSVQISLGHRGYKLMSDRSDAWMTWYFTRDHHDIMAAEVSLGADFGASVYISEVPMEMYNDRNHGQIPVDNGKTLYWYCMELYDGNDSQVTDFMGGVTATDATADGWGRVLIEDSICSRQSMRWSGWETVNPDGDRSIMMWNLERTAGLNLGEPIAQREINGILWTVYVTKTYSAEQWPFIWAVPDVDPNIAIGSDYENAVHKYYEDHGMAENFNGELWSDTSSAGAAEAVFEVLYNYWLSQAVVVEPEEEPVWPNLLPVDSDTNYGISYWSNQNTEGIFSLGGTVYQIESYREDLRFWWELGWEDMAAVTVYSIPEQGGEQWSTMMWVQETPFDTYEGDPSCYRTVNLPGNENLYLRFDGGEALADEILSNISFDYSGKEENWHTVYIGNTLQTQQSYDWTGLGMVYQDYHFDYLHNAESVDLHDQDYEGQRTINGILWTFRFHKDNGVMYAYPETEPNMGIGANPDMLWNWYDAQYGALEDYFETLVESMSVGLQQYDLRPGVVIEREPVTDPVVIEPEQTNFVQFSLGQRGYYLESDLDGAWLNWYFTEPDDGEMVADLTVGVDRNGRTEYSAKIYIAENPLDAYDHLNHGWVTVGTGDPLYWYCMELHNGDDAQIAEFMGSLTASGARFAAWGRVPIEDRIVSLQSLSWSGWETVEADGGRTVMMWNLERPADLRLGTPIAQKKINKVVWTLYITPEYSSNNWPFIWAVPDVDPNIAIGSDYENAVYKYYEDRNMTEDFDGDIWSDESQNGAAEVIFEVLQNYYPT